MTTIKEPTLRWGVSGTPWTHDIDIHKAQLGTVDFRSNWCRWNPANWSSDTHNAGNWTLADNAAFAKEIIGLGGAFVEVLVDRQTVLGGEGNSARLAISRAIATWNTKQLAMVKEEVRAVRAAMPVGTWGEIWNGDEFGPNCTFGWDPLKPEFWKALGLSKPADSTIRSRFTRFGNEIAAIWAQPERTIRASSHVYMYPDGVMKHRVHAKVQPVCTEVGLFEGFFDDASRVIQLNNTLIAQGVIWAFWHQPWPGNPGDGGAFQSGNKFMYDEAGYRGWLKENPWPEWDGIMLRGASDAVRLVLS